MIHIIKTINRTNGTLGRIQREGKNSGKMIRQMMSLLIYDISMNKALEVGEGHGIADKGCQLPIMSLTDKNVQNFSKF